MAMLGVCLSHYGGSLGASSLVGELMVTVGLVATPAFLLLSGVVAGVTLAGARDPTAQRLLLIDRGFFLLLIGHFLVGGAHAVAWGPRAALFTSFYITDAIGLFLLAVPLLMYRYRTRQLALFAVAAYVLTWAAAYWLELQGPVTPGHSDLWIGHSHLSPGISRLTRVAIEGNDFAHGGYVVPVVAYLCTLAIGFGAGRLLSAQLKSARRRQNPEPPIVRYCLTLALTLMGIAILGKLVWLGVLHDSMTGVDRRFAYETLNPFQKLPPGPAYLMFFGGAACGLCALMFRIVLRNSARSWLRLPIALGQASLIVFIVQFWFYLVAPAYFPKDAAIVRVLWFPFSVLCLYGLALWWGRIGGNRLFTIGLRFLPVRTTASDSRL